MQMVDVRTADERRPPFTVGRHTVRWWREAVSDAVQFVMWRHPVTQALFVRAECVPDRTNVFVYTDVTATEDATGAIVVSESALDAAEARLRADVATAADVRGVI